MYIFDEIKIMRKIYLSYLMFILLAGMLVPVEGIAHNLLQVHASDTVKSSKTKITDTRKNKPSYLVNGVKVNFIPFKPEVDKVFGNTFTVPAKVTAPDVLSVGDDENKVLNNVKVYPNPVTDQLNLTFMVSKDSNVTIKVMDVLGNEVITLYSERISAGNQNHSFNIASKLSSGFYFVRLVVGNETIIKRFSVL